MSILYRWISCVWAVFALFAFGFAGGPGINVPLPWIEIIGFFMLAFINFESKKIFGYVLIILIIFSIVFDAYFKLQSPYLGWNDVQKGTLIPICLLLFCAFSIWKLRSEKK